MYSSSYKEIIAAMTEHKVKELKTKGEVEMEDLSTEVLFGVLTLIIANIVGITLTIMIAFIQPKLATENSQIQPIKQEKTYEKPVEINLPWYISF